MTDAPQRPHDTEPALVVDGVTKRFGQVVALDELSLDLGPRELLTLVGPSGCGKSTLLRTIAGLVHADSGCVSINGEPVDDGRHHVPPEHRRIGLVFQEHSLFPHLRVRDNIAFGIRNRTRRDVQHRVAEMLQLVDLDDHGNRYPHELSGGERQRVALARALAPRPALMLLDEPFASLDPNLRHHLRSDVVAVLRTTGTPAVFVTHDQPEAMAIGDRVAIMRAGRIEQLADPVAVYHRPSSRFVAAFMGEATFLPIDRDAGGSRTVLGPLADGEAGTGALAMVRPDDVTFCPDVDGEAEVVDAEFRGTTWCYTVRLAEGMSVLSTGSHLRPIAVGTRGRAELTPGHYQIVVVDDQ